ncbi:Ig-like domain-containing protein [Staphylococcus aureus]|uniref:Ig-like domain-containing protein n=1 Tax=Staphylococcus aureus TaxID=1280 RepID=UPI001F29C4A8|nr:Ig-like domain-containing protein [Staphylococcus aureus]
MNPKILKNIGDSLKIQIMVKQLVTAKYDTANNLITYTFTDYVDRFNSLYKMGINYSIYMDADTIPVKNDVEFNVTIGNTTTKQLLTFNIQIML